MADPSDAARTASSSPSGADERCSSSHAVRMVLAIGGSDLCATSVAPPAAVKRAARYKSLVQRILGVSKISMGDFTYTRTVTKHSRASTVMMKPVPVGDRKAAEARPRCCSQGHNEHSVLPAGRPRGVGCHLLAAGACVSVCVLLRWVLLGCLPLRRGTHLGMQVCCHDDAAARPT
jgi:hypothetical protein